MCSLGVTKTIVLGTGSLYGGDYRAILGRHGRADGKKKMELLKVLKKGKDFQVQMQVLRSRKQRGQFDGFCSNLD